MRYPAIALSVEDFAIDKPVSSIEVIAKFGRAESARESGPAQDEQIRKEGQLRRKASLIEFENLSPNVPIIVEAEMQFLVSKSNGVPLAACRIAIS